MMKSPRLTEDDLDVFKANLAKKISRDGVKEHTADGGRGGGAVSERRPVDRSDRSTQVGTTVKSRHPYLSRDHTEAQYSEVLKRGSKGTAKAKTATPDPIKSRRYGIYRNKLEYTYAQVCEQEKHAGLIRDWAYESQTLKLAPGKYHRPDFLIWHLDGRIEIAQTKGWHANLRASMTGLVWAAQKNPWYRFTIKRYQNGWQSEEVHA